jgi:hypothetical protein
MTDTIIADACFMMRTDRKQYTFQNLSNFDLGYFRRSTRYCTRVSRMNKMNRMNQTYVFTAFIRECCDILSISVYGMGFQLRS